MKKSSDIQNPVETDLPESIETNQDLNSLQKIGSDWQQQLALKNEAILKSIEDLIDSSLGQTQD